MAQVLRWRSAHARSRTTVRVHPSQSVDPDRHYVGVASDVDERLEWHNAGPTAFTTAHRPWVVVATIEFPTEREALRFEEYLTSGSGRAFTKRSFRGRRAIEDQRVEEREGHVDPFMRGNLDLYWCQTHAYRSNEGIQ